MKRKLLLNTLTLLPIAITPAVSLTACGNKSGQDQKEENLIVYGEEIVDQQSTGVQYWVFDKNLQSVEANWSTDNTNVATINETGLLTPKSNGKVKITATSKVDSKEFGTFNVAISDSWNEFKTTWATYRTNYESTINKYKTVTLDSNHNLVSKTARASTGQVKYYKANASLLFEGCTLNLIALPIELVQLEIKALLTNKNYAVELINNQTDSIIGFKAYKNNELFSIDIWDSQLYLVQEYKLINNETVRDLIITQYNE